MSENIRYLHLGIFSTFYIFLFKQLLKRYSNGEKTLIYSQL